MRRTLALLLGLVLGFTVSYVAPGWAARNSGGTYSLPAGNPVVSGTTISSTTHNTTMSDVATAITDSLDRSGRGAMLAPLECTNGTVGAPSITFDSDTNTGIYRVGADELGITAGGVKQEGCTASGCTFPLVLTATAGSVVTQSTTDTTGGTFTGNGTGRGILSTGGATSGCGVRGIGGAPNGNGGELVGTGSGSGAVGTGGATGAGGTFAGGATSGAGIVSSGTAGNSSGGSFTGQGSASGSDFTGGATGSGVRASAGGSPSADVNTRFGVDVVDGHIKLREGNPTSSTGFSNVITPTNTIKMIGNASSSGGAYTVNAGFNLHDVTCSSSLVNFNIETDMSGAYVATVSGNTSHTNLAFFRVSTTDVGKAVVSAYYDSGGVATLIDLCATNNTINVIAVGAN